jgi:hypothetical protein
MTTTTTAPVAKHTRHPMVAFAAGVFCPGLGFVLTGRAVAGAFAVALWLLVYLVIPVLVIDHAPEKIAILPSLMLAANAAIWFGAAIIAGVLAWRDGPRARKGYEHWWWIIGWFVVVFGGFSQLRNRLLFDQMAMEPLRDTSLRPAVPEGRLLIIQKRGFDKGAVAINDVVAVEGAGLPIDEQRSWRGYARVIAKAGSVVEVKADGAVVVDGFPVVNTPCPATVPHEGHSCVHEKQATPQGTVERDTTATSFTRTFPPTSVGPGQVFVLPDDRGQKLVAPAGLIETRLIEGKVIVAER